MTPAQQTIAIVLLASVALGALYSFFLEQIHDLYSPNWIWLTVVGGNGLVILTVFILELFAIPLTGWLVLFVNVAWGAPVIVWQVWQWRQREKAKHDDATKNKGRSAGS
jgi:hypothetical protein